MTGIAAMREAGAPAKCRPAERGLTMISWLLVLIIVGILVLAGVRLVPAYVEYGEIGAALHSIRDAARSKPLDEVRSELANQLSVNSLDDVSLDEFKFVSQGDTLTISINHPIETPFIGNLGFIVHCRRSITVTRAGQP